MAALDQHFYHKSIRTYTAAFGTIFNNIKIVRESDGKVIKVPLSYSSRQKFDIEQKYENDEAHYKARFPRIGFVLTNWQRDPTRMQNKHNNIYQNIDRTEADLVNKQLNRVPYKFFYQVTVGTKNLDDMFQIMEQIAAWFNPSLNIEINENPDLGINTSINVNLTDSSLADDYEGAMEDEKTLISTFDFEVEGFLYMPSSDQGVIQKVCVNYYDLDTELKFSSESGCYPPPLPPTCCVDWALLESGEFVGQYADKEVDLNFSDFNEFRPLIEQYNGGIFVGFSGHSIQQVGSSDNYYLLYPYYGDSFEYVSFFYTFTYNPLPKFFNTMCVYFKAYPEFEGDGPAEVQFSLISDGYFSDETIVAQSDIITIPESEGNVMHNVAINIPEEYQQAPIALKISRNYVNVEIHDSRICVNGEVVPWKEPEQPS